MRKFLQSHSVEAFGLLGTQAVQLLFTIILCFSVSKLSPVFYDSMYKKKMGKANQVENLERDIILGIGVYTLMLLKGCHLYFISIN